MIGIVVPTRGTVFTQVAQSISDIQRQFDTQVFYSTDKPIPDSHNEVVKRALETEASYVLFIEEDNVPPANGLNEMLKADSDIAFIDYGVNGWSCSAKAGDEILWCGLGCTLVKREVFEKMEYPWFRTDKTFRLNDHQWTDNPSKYGGHDIWFFMQARKAGFKIKQIEGQCKHLKLDELGKSETNNGVHKISEKEKIKKHQIVEGGEWLWQNG